MERRQHLAVAFARTHYCVSSDAGEICVRTGRSTQALNRGARVRACWLLVTAANPRARRCGPRLNRRRMARLHTLLARLRLRVLPAYNRVPNGNWPVEPAALIIDPPRGLAEQIGRRFSQRALLAGGRGQRARLVWLS